MDPSNNLLVALNNWASGQQENFLTDAFVHLLNRLALEVPDAFAMLLDQITDGAINPTSVTASDFVVTAQVTTSEGMPDIEIIGPNAYALIEVKDESPVDEEQIERYGRLVEQNGSDSKCLILLTRYQAPLLDNSRLIRTTRWTQISECLLAAKEKWQFDLASSHILEQFLGFLEAKGMSVNRTGWEMTAGIEQFRNFKVLLQQAMESASAHNTWSAYGANFNGLAIPDPISKNSRYYVFVEFDNPGILVFSCASKYVREEFKSEWGARAKNDLGKLLELQSENVHFFARGLDSQRMVLEEFITSCLSQTVYESQLSE